MSNLKMLKPKLQVLDTRRVPTLAAGSRQQAAGSRQQAAGSRQQAAGSRCTKGMTSTQRGYGYKWQKAQEAFLRENPLCAMCTAQGVVAVATVVDHITPHRGDQSLFWRRSNWQSLCSTHHSRDKQREQVRR